MTFRAMLAAAALAAGSAAAAELQMKEVASGLVPSPVAYAVLLPEGYERMQDLPLILNLHGGGGSRRNLARERPLWEGLWESGVIPPVAVVMPSVTARGFYMNFHDGSERWEDFIVEEFIPHLRQTLPVSGRADRTFLMGASMGGMGALRIAFRHPEKFGAVAALEPGIEPILRWQDMRPKHRFWRDDALFERVYGKPVDAGYWAANHPPAMAMAAAERIRASGLQIYLEAGDEDEFWLYEGAEFLHRVLWDGKIRHEYHLVRGAGHLDPSLKDRSTEAIRFLIRSYRPWGPPRLGARAALRWVERQKRGLSEVDHYNQPP